MRDFDVGYEDWEFAYRFYLDGGQFCFLKEDNYIYNLLQDTRLEQLQSIIILRFFVNSTSLQKSIY